MKYDQWKIDAPDNSSPDWVRAIEEGVSNIVGRIRDIDDLIEEFDDSFASGYIQFLECAIVELKDDAMGLVEELRSASMYTLADDLAYDINHSSRYV